MKLIELSGKKVNIEGLEFTEKQFIEFFGRLKPWKGMQVKDRQIVLKEDYKIYLKHKPKDKKEEGGN